MTHIHKDDFKQYNYYHGNGCPTGRQDCPHKKTDTLFRLQGCNCKHNSKSFGRNVQINGIKSA